MEEKLLFSISDVTGLLGISRTKVYELIKTGELPVVRIGRSVRIYRPELENWLEGLARFTDAVNRGE